jgi:hypothetical protein
MSSDRPVTTTLSARALASRQNGARSRGPRTAAGKARSAQNALKHGLCAKKLLVLREEDPAEVDHIALSGKQLEFLEQILAGSGRPLGQADQWICCQILIAHSLG